MLRPITNLPMAGRPSNSGLTMCESTTPVNPPSASNKEATMAKTPKNHGKDWTSQDVQQLRKLTG
jgi:hypothetical protein